jgi:hypothetical protein
MRRLPLAAALLAIALPAAAEQATLRASRPNMTPLTLRAASSAEHWVIRVQEGGIDSQRIEVQTDLPRTRPRLADANGDGAPDLWVPVIGGNANTAWDLWIMRPAEARFVRAGELSGLAFARDRQGRLIALGRNGCCASSLLYHRFGPQGALQEAFSVERQEGFSRALSCEGVAIAEDPPAAAVRQACGLAPGGLPGTRLGVP